MILKIYKLLIDAAAFEENCDWYIKALDSVTDAERLEFIILKLYGATASKELRDSGHDIVEENMTAIWKIVTKNLLHKTASDEEKNKFWTECLITFRST